MRSQKNIISLKPWLKYLLAVMVLATTIPSRAQSDRVFVPAGSFHSVLPEIKGEPNKVDAFYLDVTAVTNEEFVDFVTENKEWRRSEVPSIFANDSYLDHWKSDLDPGIEETGAQRPVTRISWYSANAYCSAAGGRLPTLNEWEYSAQLLKFESPEEMNEFSKELIGWYSRVNANFIGAVGSTDIETAYGVKDQFGLVMEWVENFKPIIANDLSLDCGTVGRLQKLGNIYSYAASIRFITRMSFSPESTTGMLGFRCAYDVETKDTTKNSL
ncbi:MAG: formylglycine-generating enzyme family protein [Balneolaceae bacterium]|nr:formylglycine-generating enzyme family protein [Balneolaceae bacterium]